MFFAPLARNGLTYKIKIFSSFVSSLCNDETLHLKVFIWNLFNTLLIVLTEDFKFDAKYFLLLYLKRTFVWISIHKIMDILPIIYSYYFIRIDRFNEAIILLINVSINVIFYKKKNSYIVNKSVLINESLLNFLLL